jgi:hypothetical protein
MLTYLLSLNIIVALASAQVSSTTPDTPNSGNCGWLVISGEALVLQPDETLKPLNPAPIPTPPKTARGAYCVRETFITKVGDERLLQLGLPLVIRSGDTEGVLEANPTVLFNYHKDGDRYLPGKAENAR